MGVEGRANQWTGTDLSHDLSESHDNLCTTGENARTAAPRLTWVLGWLSTIHSPYHHYYPKIS